MHITNSSEITHVQSLRKSYKINTTKTKIWKESSNVKKIHSRIRLLFFPFQIFPIRVPQSVDIWSIIIPWKTGHVWTVTSIWVQGHSFKWKMLPFQLLHLLFWEKWKNAVKGRMYICHSLAFAQIFEKAQSLSEGPKDPKLILMSCVQE